VNNGRSETLNCILFDGMLYSDHWIMFLREPMMGGDYSCFDIVQGQSTSQYIQQYLRVYISYCQVAKKDGVNHEHIPASNIEE
jgi:hypothetical protein